MEFYGLLSNGDAHLSLEVFDFGEHTIGSVGCFVLIFTKSAHLPQSVTIHHQRKSPRSFKVWQQFTIVTI